MNPIITIMPWEYERCFAVGIGRFTARWNTPDAAYYDRDLMEEDRNAQAAAAICELAVAKYTNQYWHGGVWSSGDHFKYMRLADVGSNIEVRRVRTANAVMVRKKDAGKVVWAARVNDSEYRSVEILGFIAADDVIESLAGTYRDAKYVDLECLERPWLVSEGESERTMSGEAAKQ